MRQERIDVLVPKKVPDDMLSWWEGLWKGTDSAGRQELFAINKSKGTCLIRIKHKACRVSDKIYPGYTEWLVAVIGKTTHFNHEPFSLWKLEGRLTNRDKDILWKKFKITVHS